MSNDILEFTQIFFTPFSFTILEEAIGVEGPEPLTYLGESSHLSGSKFVGKTERG